VDKKIWRDAGKTASLISFLLLVTAYAFYGLDQSRTVLQAAVDLGKEQLDTVLPRAILTQWALLLGFLVLFGSLMRIPGRLLFEPLVGIAYWAMLAVAMFFVTAWLWPLLFGGAFDSVAWAGLALTVVASYLMLIVGNSRTQRRQPAAPREATGWVTRVLLGAGLPRSRWLVPPVVVVVMMAVNVLLTVVIGGIAYAVYDSARETLGGPSGRDGALLAVLLGNALFLLMMFFFYRGQVAEKSGIPAALFPFIDFSLALSACAIALSGLHHSPVTLGKVPVWLIAVGPPVVVALLVFATNLVRLRRDTPRWSVCVLAAFAAGLLVWPAKWLLGLALTPILALVPLPQL
jgi:hypothetical protein